MQDQTPQLIRSAAETAVGAGLVLTPWWAQFLTEVSLMASAVAQITGAAIGLYGVYRLLKDFHQKRR